MASYMSRYNEDCIAFHGPAGVSWRRTKNSLQCPRTRVIPSACAQQRQQKVFFVLGNAGAGKGTLCELLSSRFGIDHVSAGDLLRQEVSSGSERGKMIAEVMQAGRIVPSHITIELLRAAIESSSARGVLIDGFPRKLDQADAFEAEVSNFEFALFLDCPEEELTRRLLRRGATSGRSDDNEESIRKRFVTFGESCLPVIERYMRVGKGHRVDASRTVSDVFEEVCPLFEKALATSAAPTASP